MVHAPHWSAGSDTDLRQAIARGRSARAQAADIRNPTAEEVAAMEASMEEARALVAALRAEGREEEAQEAESVVANLEQTIQGNLPAAT